MTALHAHHEDRNPSIKPPPVFEAPTLLPSDVPVLILGTGITVLGTIRSLEKAGLHSLCLNSSEDLEIFSRSYRSVPAPFPLLTEKDDLETYLNSLPFEHAVLMPCSDNWVERVGALSEPLRKRFFVSQSSAEVLKLFVDKAECAKTLGRLNIPHPRTYCIDGPEDIEKISLDSFEGFFLKPRDSQSFFQEFQVKAFRIKDKAECINRCKEVTLKGHGLILQEYIPGPATNHFYVEGFVDRWGRLCSIFTRQRLRMYPRDFGNSTFMRAIEPHLIQDAISSIDRLLAGVKYRGIFSAEFKYDARDGQYKLLEVNTRPWWYIEFATECGINVAEMAVLDALGYYVSPKMVFDHHKTSLNFYTDIQLWTELRREKAVGLFDWLGQWLTSDHPVFSFHDPLPGLEWFLHRKWLSIFRRFFGRR